MQDDTSDPPDNKGAVTVPHAVHHRGSARRHRLTLLKRLEIVIVGGVTMKEGGRAKFVSEGVNLLNHWGASDIGPVAPIERVVPGYDWWFLTPRTNIDLRFPSSENNTQAEVDMYKDIPLP